MKNKLAYLFTFVFALCMCSPLSSYISQANAQTDQGEKTINIRKGGKKTDKPKKKKKKPKKNKKKGKTKKKGKKGKTNNTIDFDAGQKYKAVFGSSQE